MWIPHTIPKSTLQLYTPSATVGALPNEIGRAVKSEDFGWADRTPKPLRLLCLDIVAEHFARYTRQLFDAFTPMNTVYFVETLSTRLPIPSVVHVPDGEYWRRRIDDTWPNAADRRNRFARIDDDGGPKTAYLIEHVSETVGNLEPGYVDEAELSELLEACGPHVTELRCKQTLTTISLLDELTLQESNALPRDPVHVDFEFVLRRLRNVRRLGIVYGPERIAVDEEYTSHLYKINENDMDTLGRGLESSAHLVSLAVTKSAVDVTMFNRLLPYLKQCHGLKDVDFSFCRLRSPGGKSMARFAKTAAALKLLNLSGNDIGADAVESLAFVSVWRRKNGYPAIELNLNMNNIGDMGGRYLASALASGVQPFTKIRVRNCNIAEIGGVNIAQSLAYDRGLSLLQLDNNPFTPNVAVSLHAAFKTNVTVGYISAHNCDFPPKMTNFLRNVAFHNRHGKRSRLDYAEIDDLYYDVDDTPRNINHDVT